MDADEIVRILAERYGINSMTELDRRIREQKTLDISMFRSSPMKEKTLKS